MPLYASNDTLYGILVPLNKKYPLAELIATCCHYLELTPHDFTIFKYCILDGVNSTTEYVRELLRIVADVSCKFNLIPFDPFPGSGLRRSNNEQIRRFSQVLLDINIAITIRETRDDDVNMAYGQLTDEIKDRTRLAEREKLSKIVEIPVVGTSPTHHMGTI